MAVCNNIPYRKIHFSSLEMHLAFHFNEREKINTFWRDWQKIELFLSWERSGTMISFHAVIFSFPTSANHSVTGFKVLSITSASTTWKTLFMHILQGCASCHWWAQHLCSMVLSLKRTSLVLCTGKRFLKLVTGTWCHSKSILGGVTSFKYAAVALTAVLSSHLISEEYLSGFAMLSFLALKWATVVLPTSWE